MVVAVWLACHAPVGIESATAETAVAIGEIAVWRPLAWPSPFAPELADCSVSVRFSSSWLFDFDARGRMTLAADKDTMSATEWKNDCAVHGSQRGVGEGAADSVAECDAVGWTISDTVVVRSEVGEPISTCWSDYVHDGDGSEVVETQAHVVCSDGWTAAGSTTRTWLDARPVQRTVAAVQTSHEGLITTDLTETEWQYDALGRLSEYTIWENGEILADEWQKRTYDDRGRLSVVEFPEIHTVWTLEYTGQDERPSLLTIDEDGDVDTAAVQAICVGT
jgi:hypothetical protein